MPVKVGSQILSVHVRLPLNNVLLPALTPISPLVVCVLTLDTPFCPLVLSDFHFRFQCAGWYQHQAHQPNFVAAGQKHVNPRY